MTQPPTDFTSTYQQYQQAMQGIQPDAVTEALDAMNPQFDNGNLVDVFEAKKENSTIQFRILPNFATPASWWLDAYLYSYHPQGLPAGFSPKTWDKSADIFDKWLRAMIPREQDHVLNKMFSRCFSTRRALAWIILRTPIDDYEANKLYVWLLPVSKGGFKHVVEPTIRKWGVHMMSCVDPFQGREASVMVIGSGKDRSLANFEWIGEPCAAADENTLNYYFSQYCDLRETFTRLTEDDMQAYIDYYEPIVEAVSDNPQIAVPFIQSWKDRGAQNPGARVAALQYLKDKKTTSVPQQVAIQPPQVAAGQQHNSGGYTVAAPAGQPTAPTLPPNVNMPTVPQLTQNQPPQAAAPPAVASPPAPAGPQTGMPPGMTPSLPPGMVPPSPSAAAPPMAAAPPPPMQTAPVPSGAPPSAPAPGPSAPPMPAAPPPPPAQ